MEIEIKIKAEDFPDRSGDLLDAIGLEAMVKACQACGGRQMYVPMYKNLLMTARRRQIREAAARGETAEAIADALGTSSRYVEAVING